jgi:hypothetical protein
MLLPAEVYAKKAVVPDSLKAPVFQVGEVSFKMQRVEGGAFVMGATPDQYDEHTISDKPAHTVVLSPFYIAETEVTNELWHAVMPDRRFVEDWYDPTQPITYVTWEDAQLFVHRLDSLTGMPFRLPTEAEWEYAARGGSKSKGFRFAGSDLCDTVSWNTANAGFKKHQVKKKQPNELGLYDMTGNVAEWCQDIYGPYQLSTRPDPCGADTGSFRIVRGGSYDDCVANSHLSVRRWYEPETTVGYIGFRVALTLPDDPMMQVVPDEPELTQKVRVKGRKLHFDLVPGDEPFYLSEEISAAFWKKVMGVDPADKDHGSAIGMSSKERARFAELCSRLSEKPLAVASLSEIDTALSKGVILKRKNKKEEQDVQSRSSLD